MTDGTLDRGGGIGSSRRRLERALGTAENHQMNARKTTRNPGGRPRSADRSELTAAQIEKQDAYARRLSTKIRRLLETHVPAAHADRVWRAEQDRLRGLVERWAQETVPDVMAVHGKGRAHVEAALRQSSRTLLQRLAEGDGAVPVVELLADLPSDPLLERPRPVHASKTLAAARARVARLQARRITLEDHVVLQPGRVSLLAVVKRGFCDVATAASTAATNSSSSGS